VSRICEWWGPRALGVSCGAIYWVLFRKTPVAPAFKDVLSATLTVGAITVGFLITAAGTLLAVQSDNRTLRLARDAGAYRLLVEYIISAARWNFLATVLSAAGLILDWQHFEPEYTYGITVWIIAIAVALLSVMRVFSPLAELLRANSSRD
jgi:sugar (pentulose or hexulose) kinase